MAECEITASPNTASLVIRTGRLSGILNYGLIWENENIRKMGLAGILALFYTLSDDDLL